MRPSSEPRDPSKKVPAPSEDYDRAEYLVESRRAHHEEFLLRVSSRDRWLREQLLGQGVLVALALGVQFGGASSQNVHPGILYLSIPVAFVLGSLYVIEDRVISLLLSQLALLDINEARLAGDKRLLYDSSVTHHFDRNVLWVRYVTLCVAFIVLPSLLAWLGWLWSKPLLSSSLLASPPLPLPVAFYKAAVFFDLLLNLLTFGLITWATAMRRKESKGRKESLESQVLSRSIDRDEAEGPRKCDVAYD